MNTVKAFVMLTVCGCASGITGCRTTPKADYRLEWRKITVLSEPSGATVTQLYPFERGSRELGKTPLLSRSVLVMTDITFQGVPFSEAVAVFRYADSVIVRVEKDGYEPYRATIATKADESAARKCVLKPLPRQ